MEKKLLLLNGVQIYVVENTERNENSSFMSSESFSELKQFVIDSYLEVCSPVKQQARSDDYGP